MKLNILIATLLVAISLSSCIYQERADWQTTPTKNSHVGDREPNTKLTECWTSPDKRTKTLNIFFACDDLWFFDLCANINYKQSDTSYISIKGKSEAVGDIRVSNYIDYRSGARSKTLGIRGHIGTFRDLWYDAKEPLDVEWKSKDLRLLQLDRNQKFTAADTVSIRKMTRFELRVAENTEINFDVLICDTLCVNGDLQNQNIKINTLIANAVYTTTRWNNDDGSTTPIGPSVGKFIKKATMEEAEMDVLPAY